MPIIHNIEIVSALRVMRHYELVVQYSRGYMLQTVSCNTLNNIVFTRDVQI